MSARRGTVDPSERQISAQGEERNDAALGCEPQRTSSLRQAKEGDGLCNRWRTAPLGEVVDILDSRRVPVNAEERVKRFGDVPYYGATGQVGCIDKPIFDEELVLLGEDGAPFLDPGKPKAYLIRGKSWVNNHAHVLRGKPGLLNAFLLYQLNAIDYRPFVSGTTRLKLPQGPMKQIPLLVPAEDEQRRIVAEIEKQFTRLEVGGAALRRVQANLKRYRAAVLKAACEGRLVPTEADLAKTGARKSKFETGEALLARILTERRKNWQGRGQYKEPTAADTTKLSAIAEGWVVASLEQLTSAVRPICYGILMPKENVVAGVLFVKVKDMKGDKIDLASLHRTTPEIAAKYARASLRTGDLLLSIRGTYGRVAEVPKELDGGNITQDTARLDVTGLVDHRYVATCVRNPDCQNYFKRVARGVAVKGVNIGDVRPAPIPLPPLAEQTRIVSEVERRLSVVEELEAVVSANLQRATRLRQSILQKAFTGELV